VGVSLGGGDAVDFRRRHRLEAVQGHRDPFSDEQASLIVLPVSVFAFFVRKSIVQGLTMGALKD
jgi:hypothetical protein